MKSLNSNEFQKSLGKSKKKLIISLVFLGILIIFIVLGINYENKKLPKAVDMKDFIVNNETEEDVYAYVDVNTKPYLFAAYEVDGKKEDNKYYLVMDSNKYLFILYMSSDNYNKLNNDSISNNPIRVNGLTKKIKKEIKDLAISAYNDEMKNEYLTDENFKEYVGLVYLDMESKVYDASLYYIIAFFSFFLFLIYILIYLKAYLKNKKVFKNYSKEELETIGMEIYKLKENNPYQKMNFYILDNYIVDMSNGIIILKYKDIIWAHIYEYRYNGLVINKNIKVYDIKNKVYDIANTKYLDKNKEQTLEEIIIKLKEQNSEILMGFNKENGKKYKEIIKKNK